MFSRLIVVNCRRAGCHWVTHHYCTLLLLSSSLFSAHTDHKCRFMLICFTDVGSRVFVRCSKPLSLSKLLSHQTWCVLVSIKVSGRALKKKKKKKKKKERKKKVQLRLFMFCFCFLNALNIIKSQYTMVAQIEFINQFKLWMVLKYMD